MSIATDHDSRDAYEQAMEQQRVMESMSTFEGKPMITYGEEEGAMFVRECPVCGRFVKADAEMEFNGLGEAKMDANAECKVHGRVLMPFVGYM